MMLSTGSFLGDKEMSSTATRLHILLFLLILAVSSQSVRRKPVILPSALNPKRPEKPRTKHTPEHPLLHPQTFHDKTQTHQSSCPLVVVAVPSIPGYLVPMVWDWQAWLTAEADE